MDRRNLLRAACAALGFSLAGQAAAQPAAFPNHPLRIVVPFAAGGPTDVMARALAQKLGEALGQSVIVDNRPGGGAQIAAAALKSAPPDGHTIFIGDVGAFAVNPSLYTNLSYDPIKDFQPLTMLMSAPMTLMVRTDSPVRGLREYVAAAKAGAKPFTMGSQGVGTGGHLSMEMLKSAAGVEFTHVPYKGSAPALQDLLAGQIDALFEVLPAALPQASAGKVRVIAVAANKRAAQLPDVPTTAELGFADVRMDAWFAAVTLMGTPDATTRRLSTEIGRAMRDPAVNKRFIDQGFVVEPGTPEQLGALIKSEVERWGVIVKRSGAKAD